MPVYYRPDWKNSLTPWNDWANWLLDKPDGAKHFKNSQGNTSGFIIIWCQEEYNFIPTHYLRSIVRTFGLNEGSRELNFNWEKINDDTCSEDPKQYTSLKKALRIIKELRQIHDTERIGLVFWKHPESHYKPSDRYIIMLS